MPISLATDFRHLNMTAPQLPQASSILDTSHLLAEEETDRLLSNLVQTRWRRLACQDADPLGMLFNDRAKQWTAGWESQQQALLLLVWETDSWQNKPCWSLYRNGQLIFRATEGLSAQRHHWLSQLLESPQLPTIEPVELLARIHDFRYIQEAPQAVEQIRQTAIIHPDFLNAIKDTLFSILETDLGSPEWPTLEVLKLHRLQHKNPVISLFRDWLQQSRLTSVSEAGRLQTALNQLQQDYLALGQTIQPLFKPTYQQSYQEFRTLLTHCQWRIQMLKALPKNSMARPQAASAAFPASYT